MANTARTIVLIALIAVASQTASRAQQPVYKDPKAPVESRVNDLLSRLTQDEKLDLLSTKQGNSLDGTGIPRLGVAALHTSDGPQGVRSGQSTAFPMGVVSASAWDPPLTQEIGAAIGTEAKALGDQVIFGPTINIQRTPQGGRFFENASEDPFVASQFAEAYVVGMQSQGVAACPKHYVGNDQEYNRLAYNATIDERAMHEIYLRTFHAALVDAHAWSLMTSFNKVNGTRLAESKQYDNDLLKTEWDWDGVIIGDWGSIHDTALSMTAGLDLEIPNPNQYSQAALSKALATGTITQAQVDEAVKRLLRLMIRTGLADDPPAPKPTSVDCPEHRAIALKTAEEGITLLKNERGIMPLDRTKLKAIAVIGPNAQETQLGGRWSADSTPFYRISVLDGIKSRAATGTVVSYAQGCNRFGVSPDSMIQDAAALAAKSDVAIVVVGTDSSYLGEDLDPVSLYLPGAQEKLIQAVATANKNTIVVLNNGMPILMDRWLKQVPGLLEAWYSGQEGGNAVAEILFGDINPSGHLTCTIASRREDYSDWPNYPGVNNEVNYAEGIYVGYRHFDKANITPLFPFGYGQSYTSFSMNRLKLARNIKRGDAAGAQVRVKNTGKLPGDEVVQLYIHPINPRIDRPIRELKGFQRVHLKPGETQQVSIPIAPDAFSYWDVTTHAWKGDPGDYEIEVGDSSRNILASGKVSLK